MPVAQLPRDAPYDSFPFLFVVHIRTVSVGGLIMSSAPFAALSAFRTSNLGKLRSRRFPEYAHCRRPECLTPPVLRLRRSHSPRRWPSSDYVIAEVEEL